MNITSDFPDTRAQELSEPVVLADEEDAHAEALAGQLARLGHPVVRAGTGEQLIVQLRAGQAHNLLLSATLPDASVETICGRLRSLSATWNMIVVFPAYDELETVLGLEAGADDCVTRPCHAREVVARFRAIQRRRQPEKPGEPLNLGDVVLDVQRREVTVGKVSVELTRKEFDLLALLIEHRSLVVSRDIITERVWNGTWSSRTIDTHMASLRAKLGRPDLIRTVRGVGFKLAV